MSDVLPSYFEGLLLECNLLNETLTLRFDRHLYPACETYGIFQVRFDRIENSNAALEFYRRFIGQNIAIWMVPHPKGFQLVDYYYDEDWQTGLPEYPELYCGNYSTSDEPDSMEYLKTIIKQSSEEIAKLGNDYSSQEQRHRRQGEQIDLYFCEEIRRASLKADGVADDQAKIKFLNQQMTLEKAYKAIQFILEKRG